MSIRYETTGRVVLVTLDRPEVLNALDIAHLQTLLEAIRRAGADDDVRVMVITGTGRSFSAGADITMMDKMEEREFIRVATLFQDLAREIHTFDKIVICAVNGYAVGGGLELALMGDLRIAARSAVFGLPDAELGFSPTGGLTHHLVRMIGLTRAMGMALTCDRIDAAEAERIGLINRVVDDAELTAAVSALAKRIAGFPRTGLRNTKRAFLSASDADLADTLVLEERFDLESFRSSETRDRLADFVAARKNVGRR